jgi:hypothetical protein
MGKVRTTEKRYEIQNRSYVTNESFYMRAEALAKISTQNIGTYPASHGVPHPSFLKERFLFSILILLPATWE